MFASSAKQAPRVNPRSRRRKKKADQDIYGSHFRSQRCTIYRNTSLEGAVFGWIRDNQRDRTNSEKTARHQTVVRKLHPNTQFAQPVARTPPPGVPVDRLTPSASFLLPPLWTPPPLLLFPCLFFSFFPFFLIVVFPPTCFFRPLSTPAAYSSDTMMPHGPAIDAPPSRRAATRQLRRKRRSVPAAPRYWRIVLARSGGWTAPSC